MRLYDIITPLQFLLSPPAVSMGSIQHHDAVPSRIFTPTNYSVVPGIFVQDEPHFNATGYDLLQDSFGLLDKSAARWAHLRSTLDALNSKADDNTAYKLLYIARHGQGWHNVGEAKYGSEEWDRYWSRVEGDDEMTWGPDPLLTPLGEAQARKVNAAWKREMRDGVPLPTELYSSPMSRSAATLNLTWGDILIEPRGVTPLIREGLRETIGMHTCDKRSTRSIIASRFPSFDFEVPFSEFDQLYHPLFRESNQQQALRLQQVLNQLFATTSSPVVSLTCHGGVIDSIFRVVGHNMHAVPPGGFVPVLVKAVRDTKEEGKRWAGGRSLEVGPLPTQRA